ncbi:MAG: peptidoglycan-associated lipoprotein Pal [Gemmatimonadota bacterium]
MARSAKGIIYALAAASLVTVGCAGTKPAPVPEQPTTQVDQAAEEARRLEAENRARMAADAAAQARTEAARQAQIQAAAEAERQARQLSPIYFDYDRYQIREDQMVVLRSGADKLQAAAQVSLVLEGHADERGTIEYNLALGQRRADAVRSQLVRLGIAGERLETVSYGEDRPADSGRNEAAWARNRRVELVANP